MLRRPHYIALGLVLLSALILLNLPGKTTARLKLGISSLFVPLFGLASSTQQALGKAADAVLPRSELVRQNEALRRENQELRLELTRAEPLARENERLRDMLHWQQQQKRGKYKAQRDTNVARDCGPTSHGFPRVVDEPSQSPRQG